MNRVKKIIKATFLLTFALIFSMSTTPLLNVVNADTTNVLKETTAGLKVGDDVRVSDYATQETNGVSLISSRGWAGTIKSVSQTNFDRSHYEYYVEYPDGKHNDHVSEQDLIKLNQNIHEGDLVQIKDSAQFESNGYDLKPRRNQHGVVVSAKLNRMFNSYYEYDVRYNDGSHSEHVLEQDLAVVTPMFKVGDKVKAYADANLSENGADFVSKKGLTGTVESLSVKDNFYFIYTIKWSDGSTSSNIAEYYLRSVESQYKVGDLIKISGWAYLEANGYDLTPRRDWQGVIKSIATTDKSVSSFEYVIEYGNGIRSEHVLEQDIRKFNPLFKKGEYVTIDNHALNATDNSDITSKEKYVGEIQNVNIKFFSNSVYEYSLKLSNGEILNHISEQVLHLYTGDLSAFNPPLTIVSTIDYDVNTTSFYLSRADNKYRVFYAINENGRNDGLYDAPYGTVNNISQNTDAKALQGKIVYAETEVKLSNGETWVKIYITDDNGINGQYKWINKKALITGVPTVSPVNGNTFLLGIPVTRYASGLVINSYNKEGKILYKIQNSKYETSIRTAINNWNKALGENVFVEATSSTPTADINLTFSDYFKDDGTLGLYNSTGTITLNDKNLVSAPQSAIMRTIQHELGHSLGLEHTGIVTTDFDQTWSWSKPTDAMWSQLVISDETSESIITKNDISAVKMLRAMGDFANSHPLSTLRTILPIVWIQ